MTARGSTDLTLADILAEGGDDELLSSSSGGPSLEDILAEEPNEIEDLSLPLPSSSTPVVPSINESTVTKLQDPIAIQPQKITQKLPTPEKPAPAPLKAAKAVPETRKRGQPVSSHMPTSLPSLNVIQGADKQPTKNSPPVPTQEPANDEDSVLKSILSEQDEVSLDPKANLDSMIRSFLLDKTGADDAELLSQVQGYEKKLLDVEDSRTLLQNLDERRRKTELNTTTLSRSRLDKITMQLAKMKKSAGMPTCISISTKYIAIGTSHGLVVVFDHFQDVKVILGMQEGAEYGPVQAIDISFESEWLGCGHQEGQVVVWDVLQGSPVKTFIGDFKTSITFVRFIDNKKNRLLACSLDGIAKLFRISNVLLMWVVETQLVLSGAAGPILAMANLNPGNQHNPVDNYSLVAFCTTKKVAIVAIQQTIRVMHQIPRPDGVSGSCLPYLAWREVIIRDSKDGKRKVLDPVLAVAWGKAVYLLQVVTGKIKSRPNQLDFIPIAEYYTDSNVTGFQWLGPSVLVMLNAKDELRVFDPFALEEIEIAPAKAMEIVYHSKFTNEKGDPEYSFHNSVKTFKNHLYMLGLRAVYTAHVLTWEERIAAYVNKGKWMEALALALDFYQGRARAVEGLPKDMYQAKKELGLKIEQLLHDYVEVNLNIPNARDPRHYDTVATIAIDYCLNIGREDILFEQLSPLFFAAKKQGMLLQKLEPFILGDKLTKLPPDIIQQLVAYYTSAGLLRRMEQIILHLDIASIDFHQVVKLCSKHYLSSALFYVFISALQDYITPLDYLMRVLVKDSHLFSTPEQHQLRKTIGYKILVYLSYIFAGKNFPMSTLIVPSKYEEIKQSLFDYLLRENVEGGTEKFARVVSLLHVDASEFFRVLGIAFDGTSSSRRLRQWLDVLVALVVDTSVEEFSWTEKLRAWPYSPKQVGLLFEFIAKYFARGVVDVPHYILQRVLAYLVLSTDSSSVRERERLLLEILHSSAPPARLQYDRLLILAENARFYKACEFFYRIRRDFAKVLRCHMLDTDLRLGVFTWIANAMRDDSLSKPEKETIKNTTITNLNELVKIDSDKTSVLVTEVFTNENERVVKELEPYPELQYAYLRSVMQQIKAGREMQLSVNQGERLLELMCRFDKEAVKDWLSEFDSYYRLDNAISLTGKYQVLQAHCMLLEKSGDFTKALDVYSQSIDKKMAAILSYVTVLGETAHIDDLDNYAESPLKTHEEDVRKALSNAIMFCKRNSNRMDPQEMKSLWFRLLDAVMKPLGDLENARKGILTGFKSESGQSFSRSRGAMVLKSATEEQFTALSEPIANVLRQTLTSLISYVLEHMIGHIPMQTILEKLVSDRGDSRFGDFRSIFVRMLDNYAYEQNILETSNQLLRYDTWRAFSADVAQRKRAFRSIKDAPDVKMESDPDKLYRFRVDNYTPPQEKSRWQILRELETSSSGFASAQSGKPSSNEAKRRELFYQQKFQLLDRRPGMLDKDSRFYNALPKEEQEVFSKMK